MRTFLNGVIAAALFGRAGKVRRRGRNEAAYAVLERTIARANRARDPVRGALVPLASEMMAELAVAMGRPAAAEAVLHRALREIESHANDSGWAENAPLLACAQRMREQLVRLQT